MVSSVLPFVRLSVLRDCWRAWGRGAPLHHDWGLDPSPSVAFPLSSHTMLCPHLLFPLSQYGHFRPLLIPQNTDDAHTSLLRSPRGWVAAWHSFSPLPHIHLNSSRSCPQAASSAFNVVAIPFGRMAPSSGCLFLSGCHYKVIQVLISAPSIYHWPWHVNQIVGN